MNCVCGHPERAHVLGGKCRVPDCPCERFQPGDTLYRVGCWGAVAAAGVPRPRRRLSRLVLIGVLAITFGSGHLGGPVVNLAGEIIGLGTVLFGDGIAYVVPSRPDASSAVGAGWARSSMETTASSVTGEKST